MAFLFTMEYGSKAFLDYWLSWWAADHWGWESNHLGIYFAIFLFNGIAIFLKIKSCCTSSWSGQRIARSAIESGHQVPDVLLRHHPKRPRDQQILRDTETIDTILPGIIIQFLGCITSIVTTLAIVSVATGWTTLALPFIMFVYIASALLHPGVPRASAH